MMMEMEALVPQAGSPLSSSEGRHGRRRFGLLAAGLCAVAVVVWLTVMAVRWGMWSDWSDPVWNFFTFAAVAAPWVLVASGILLRRWRPASPSGLLLVGLGALVAAWLVSQIGSTDAGLVGSVLALGFRVLLFSLVLGWPGGRLSRGNRLFLAFFAATLSCCWLPWLLLDPHAPQDASVRNPVALAHLSGLSEALVSIGSYVVLPAGAVVLLILVVRRFRALPRPARRLAVPALWAGCLVAAGDLVLTLADVSGPNTSNGLVDVVGKPVGPQSGAGLILVAVFDLGRFVAVPALLVWAAWRSRPPMAESTPARTVDVGRAVKVPHLRDSIAIALGDPSVQVAFHRDGAGWVDTDGHPIALGRPGRAVIMIERKNEPVAAVEHDASLRDRPTILEGAVAAASATIDYERLSALSRARQAEALRARRSIVEVADAARRRLERDLHDGAQQRLVGLALQASLAERAGADRCVVTALKEGVAAARSELPGTLDGLLPAVRAERGLEAALAALAATAPLKIDIDLSVPADLPAVTATTAWFVAAEAVANAIKHAQATRLRICGGVDGSLLSLTVADDGLGGANEAAGSGLRGLRERTASVGGCLTVATAPGAGTTIRLVIPAGSAQ